MDTAAMLEFCANHSVALMCEQFDIKDINRAVQHVRDGKARYRVVLAKQPIVYNADLCAVMVGTCPPFHFQALTDEGA